MKLRYYIILFGVLAMVSCQKKLDVKDAPDFSVSIVDSSTTYKAGDPINFSIQGGADVISFYSGEVFHDYTFKDGREVDVTGKGLNMSFNSAVAPGTPAGTQKNQFSILASTDFNGDYSSLASVQAAHWTDITKRFTLSTGTAFTPSGKKDVSDLLAGKSTIYFALKYINWPQLDSGWAKQWQVEGFTLTSNDSLNNAPVTIADQVHTGFRIVDQYPDSAKARSTITATRATLYGPAYKNPADSIYNPHYSRFDPKNPIYDPTSPQYVPNLQVPVFVAYDPNSPYNDPYSENWAVSAPISVDKVNLGADWATPVTAGIYLTQPAVFNYTYSSPGTYKAYFVASNNTIDKSKQVTKEITITITP